MRNKHSSSVSARKIPQILAALALARFGVLAIPPVQAQAPDTTQLFRAARQAEAEYLKGIRKNAPFRAGLAPGPLAECDERVGRYCVIYDTGQHELPDEPRPVRSARAAAIAALEAAFQAAPGRTATAFPLVHLLVRAGRPEAADTVARAYARARPGGDAHMLLGFALHAERRTEEALGEFSEWQKTLLESERQDIADVAWLLSDRERTRYRQMPMAARPGYTDRLWRFADALYLTPGNETWADHLARHALGRMLVMETEIAEADPFDVDARQLTIRFGEPVLTTRSFQGGAVGVAQNFSEHWDPSERTYVPFAIDSILNMSARVDTIWPIERVSAHSGHAPPTIRLMRPLELQAAAFPDSVARLLVAGGVPVDKTAAGKALSGAVFLLDGSLRVISRHTASVQAARDSAAITADVPLPASALYYSVELYDTTTRFAGRARYRIDLPTHAASLSLSGVLLAQPFEAGALPARRTDAALHTLTRPVISSGSRFGVYGEITSRVAARSNVSVELELRSVDKPSGVTRLAGWIGARLGLARPESPTRLGWTVELEPGQVSPIALTIDPGKLAPGYYVVSLTVTDPADTSKLVATRDLLVTAPGKRR